MTNSLKKNIKVILSTDPDGSALWDFVDYGTQSANLFIDWYRSLSPEARDRIDADLKNCRKTAKHEDWLCFKRFLKGEYQSQRIWELRFKADRREHRILGIFGLTRKQAILLMGCYHKDGN